MPVERGDRVRLHYRLALPDGKEVESSFSGEPVEIEVGARQVPPGLDDALLGLERGDRRRLDFRAGDAVMGDYDPERVQGIDLDDFPEDVTPGPGVVIGFALPSGEELPGLVREIGERHAVVDFNHPLAGRDFVYEVEIVEIRKRTEGAGSGLRTED